MSELSPKDSTELAELQEFDDVTIKEEDEYLRTLLKDLTGDDFRYFISVPDNRLRALPVVLKLYVSGYDTNAIAKLTGIPQRRLQGMIKKALRLSVLRDIEDIRLTVYNSLREFGQKVAPKAGENVRWGRLYLEILQTQLEMAGNINLSKPLHAPNFMQQIIVNQGSEGDKKKPVPKVDVVEADIVETDDKNDFGD